VRPLLLVGTALAAGGFAWLSQIQFHSQYWESRLRSRLRYRDRPRPAIHTARLRGHFGVPFNEGRSGLRRAQYLAPDGGSIGLAVLATIAIDRTHDVLNAGIGQCRRRWHSLRATPGIHPGTLLCLAAFVASFIIPYIRIGPRQASETEGREGLDVLVDIEGEALLTCDPTVSAGTPLPGDGSA